MLVLSLYFSLKYFVAFAFEVDLSLAKTQENPCGTSNLTIILNFASKFLLLFCKSVIANLKKGFVSTNDFGISKSKGKIKLNRWNTIIIVFTKLFSSQHAGFLSHLYWWQWYELIPIPIWNFIVEVNWEFFKSDIRWEFSLMKCKCTIFRFC